MKVCGFAILAARPWEKHLSWEWMYTRKVSDDQRPNFCMTWPGVLAKCRAMAPPARSEWLLTRSGGIPWLARLSSVVARLTAVEISLFLTVCRWLLWKKV